jgi:hypothetical protein
LILTTSITFDAVVKTRILNFDPSFVASLKRLDFLSHNLVVVGTNDGVASEDEAIVSNGSMSSSKRDYSK